MALVMTPIFRRTVSGTTTSSVTLSNIPQYFTDLKLLLSLRDNNAFDTAGAYMQLNADGRTLYSSTSLGGTGGSSNSSRRTGEGSFFTTFNYQGSLTTANTFSNTEIYIPNYTGTNFKQVIFDGITESNSATIYQNTLNLSAGLYRSSDAIQSLIIYANTNFTAGSTFSLYGIIRSGA